MNPTRKIGARIALAFLLLLAFVATFADLFASDLPLLMGHGGKVFVLPKLSGELVGPAGQSALAGADWAVWSPLPFDSALAQAIHGARHTVLLAGGVLLVALAIGTVFGTLAGRGPLLVDALLARSVELTGAIPVLVLVVVARAWDGRWTTFVMVVGILRGVRIARLVRGEVLRISGQDFVQAARALGVPGLALLRRHVLPHALGPALVSAAATAAFVVGLEAALSFTGLGSAASWGGQLGHAMGRPAQAFWPALGIVATTLSLFAVADALDDSLSARRGRPARALRSLGG